MKTTLKLMTLLFLLMTSIGRSHATTPSGNFSTDYCKDVTVKTGERFLQVTGLSAPWSSVQYRKDGSSRYSYMCKDNCGTTHGVSGILPGTYHVKIVQSDNDGKNRCVKEFTVQVKSKKDFCTDVRAVGGEGEISVTGVHAPWSRIQYRNYGSSHYQNMCDDNCGNPQKVSGIMAGRYIVKIEQSAGGNKQYCVKEIVIQVKVKPIDFCEDVSAVGGEGKITISGIKAPWQRVTYRKEGSYYSIDVCADDCGNPEVIKNVPAGKYIVKVELSSRHKNYCMKRISVTVTKKKVDFCKDVKIAAHPGKIIITGIHAPANRVLIKGPSTNYKLKTMCHNNCFHTPHSQLAIKNLKGGDYIIIVEQSSGGQTDYCKVEQQHHVQKLHHGKVIGEQDNNITANLYNPTNQLTQEVANTLSLTGQDFTEEVTELISDNSDLAANHNLDKEAITLFPNPAQNELSVSVNAYAGQQADLVVVNQVGAVVEMMRIEALPESPLSINVSAYTNGLYFLRVQVAGSDFITKKFVVRK